MWTAGWIGALVLAAAGCERAAPAPVQEVQDVLGRVRCRLQDGKIECNGLNTWGVVRNPAAEIAVEAWHRIPINERVTRIDLSYMGLFACAATASGRAFCWGDASEGALGHGELPPSDLRAGVPARPVPQQVVGLADVKDLGLGVRHACALTHGGAVLCWGTGGWGALGDGNDHAPSALPITVIADGARSIAVADFQTCAVMSTGRVRCWGDHLPDRAGVPRAIVRPTEVADLEDVTAVSGVLGEMCAVRRGGTRQCWRTAPDRFEKH